MDNDDTLHYSSDLVIILNMTIELRDYQEQLVNEVITILNKHNNGFLESPTGSGKSAMMLTIAMRFKPTQSKKVAVVCHQENLYKQTSERIKKYFNIDLKESVDDQITVKVENTTFVFMTWQKLKNIINKEYYDLLIVDEAHWGSSIPFGQQQTKEHKSFLKIFRSKNIGARLYVSATLLRLDQDVYKGLLDEKGNPQRKYLANLALSKAASLGIISDINIIPISTTDTLKLKNLSTGKEEMLEREDVETLAPDVKQKEANIKAEISKKALEEGALNSVLEVIAQREWKNGDIQSIDHIPPLLVFANGVNSDSPLSVKNVIDGFKKKAREVFKDKISLNKYFIFLAHSGNLPGNAKSSQVIDDFSKGKIKILVVSDMCREGFDYPELKAILDLVPSRNNVRCFLQTLGRVMRPSLNKEVKRYYYPDTLQCRLKAKNGVTSELSSETQSSLVEGIKSVQAEKSFSEEDVNTFVEMTKDGLSKICEAQAVQQHEEDAAYATGVESLQKYISIDPEVKEAYTVDLPFVITDSYTRDVNRLLINLKGDRLFDILQIVQGARDPKGKELELFEWANSGKDKPLQYANDHNERSLACFLQHSCNITHESFRPDFNKKIRISRPDWFEDTVTEKIELILRIAKNGGDRPRINKTRNPAENELGNFLRTATNRKNPYYREDFDKVIRKMRPDWFEDTVNLKQLELENKWYKKGILPPTSLSLYSAHVQYHSKAGAMYQMKWSKKMKERYSFLNLSILDRSFQKMISMMPKNVRIKSGQKWKGVAFKYIFFDKQFGQFEKTPYELMTRCWNRGLSGHPQSGHMSGAKTRSKKVYCPNNQKIYNSLAEASRDLSLSTGNIWSVLQGKRKTAGGYTFVYEKSVRNRKRK